MPTYEYRCKDCNHEWEAVQKITAERLDKCPVCGGAPERLISGRPGFVLKGSCWGRDGYGNAK